MRLLLIEDDSMFAEALVRGLKRIGMKVDWARNGSDGYEALRRAEHSVALLDIGLPEMSLMERPGSILSRSQIENRICGWDQEIQGNAVDVVIHGLRKKYGKDIIRNIRDAGWMVANSKP